MWGKILIAVAYKNVGISHCFLIEYIIRIENNKVLWISNSSRHKD